MHLTCMKMVYTVHIMAWRDIVHFACTEMVQC